MDIDEDKTTSTNLLEELDVYLKRLPKDLENYYRNVIEKKEMLSIKVDFVFKTLFDADIHKERLSKFLSLLLGFRVTVISSLYR